VVTQRFGDLTVHAVRSGFVASKEAHRTLVVPDALRLLAIALDRRWTEWMPILTYVIEHPDGVIVVDAGQIESTGDADALDCDPGTRWFYRHQLRLAFRPEERIDRRLGALGIDVAEIRAVVLTHRHADHADGLSVLGGHPTVYVGAADWPGHQGALPAHWPSGVVPTLVADRGEPCDAFAATVPLVGDGRVRAVALGGHSPGHLGVRVECEGGLRLLFAGDAVFSLEQVRTGTIAGICERPRDARATLGRITRQLAEHPTVLLPAHEPAALERLRRGEPTRLDAAHSMRASE
jgi:glyoxylase-like metal-dependent hydrolase (beta-lactamase superfamily II)